MGCFKYLIAPLLLAVTLAGSAFALSSPNVPLDSPIYLYIEKLSGFGLVVSDFKGIRPYSRSEVARLLKEAEKRLDTGGYPPLARELVTRIKELIPREASLYSEPEKAPLFDFNPASSARLRYVYLDGVPRSYLRYVRDTGGDWDFPLPVWRPKDPGAGATLQRGTEGTPLFENNEGIFYGDGHNIEARWSSEAYLGSLVSGLVEPLFLASSDDKASEVRLNKGYLKVGGGPLELEAGRDANWLGLGYRGAITLTNNAPNFTSIKLSSPEPVTSRFIWDLKYDLIFSQFDKTVTYGIERQPWFNAVKLSFKPYENLEFGFNLGRQVGGAGIDNQLLASLRGLWGATSNDNSNSLGGVELRLRFPWLRNSEIFAELSGEDRQWFWPKAQSYLAGFFVPRLTASGRDDLRFEFFYGHPILYTNATFPNGYLYHNFPIGDSQGGATEDFFLRYSHWFSARNNAALEFFYTIRGQQGRISVDAAGQPDPNGVIQPIERKFSVRAFWSLPVYHDWDALFVYGWERVDNWDLQQGEIRTNQLIRAELSYKY